jgi:tagaturonate reductase
MNDLPETILHFGSGKFLRGFADLFIHQANQEGQAAGQVVVVQTSGDQRARLLNQQGGRYHVLVRGLEAGQVIDRVETSASILRALAASGQWPEVLAVARSRTLRHLISNTAEAGYNLDPADRPGDAPPRSFPAKLLFLLKERFEAGLPGLTIFPCELFEQNADRLCGIVLGLAASWGFPARLTDWIGRECVWHNTLVDRIVALPPAADPHRAGDPLAVVAEPFALWAITGEECDFIRHPAVRRVPDVRPLFLRKVRILNAAHTALVSQAVPRGFATVREAVLDPAIGDWLHRLLFEEIIPTLEGRVEAPEEFARQTLERFRNPFIEHKMSDVQTYHAERVRIRLVPTRDEYVAKFGRRPRLLDEAIGSAA